MNRQLIDTFLEVLETRNFNRAAERLNVMQSTISARIRQLEDIIGARLFERGRGGAEPTAAARRFEPHAHSFIALWGNMQSDMRLAGKANSRLLRLSCQYSLLGPFLMDWSDRLRQENSRITYSLETNFSVQIQRDILSGDTDLGVMFAPQLIPDLYLEPLTTIEFSMVSTTARTVSEIRASEYAKVRYTNYFERIHDQSLPEFALPPLLFGSEDIALESLKRNGGTLYLPGFRIASAIAAIPNLQVVTDAPSLTHPVYCAMHIRKKSDPLIVWALRSLKATLEANSIEHSDQSADPEI